MVDYLRIILNARFAKMDERGASAVEYGLLIAGIAALIVVVVFAFGGNLVDIFANTCKAGASMSTLIWNSMAPRPFPRPRRKV